MKVLISYLGCPLFFMAILHAVTDADFYRSIFADRPRCRNGCVASYAPISAPCYRQKSTRYKFRIRGRVKYIYKPQVDN